MAFNWDKLCKAQSDYPKPKFALDAIGRLLKKRPSDPYILSWKASVLLQLDYEPKDVINILVPLCQRQPPIIDHNLLAYVYKLILEATRRSNPHCLSPPSVGGEGLKAWQNAVKAIGIKMVRLTLWSELFVAAMREDCWEDARYAVVQANKEGLKDRKTAYYSLILANQLAAEKKLEANKDTGKIDPGSQIQLTLALRQMKEAYDNSPKPTDDAIRVANVADLRFMASIYRRQNRCTELFNLWDQPPKALETIMRNYKWDLKLLQAETAQDLKEWKLLETVCREAIEEHLKVAEEHNFTHPLKDLCATRWLFWSGFVESTKKLYSTSESSERIDALCSRLYALPVRGRSFSLTYMTLQSNINKPLLPICKAQWAETHHLDMCFRDLRRLVARLSAEEQKSFLGYITEKAQSLKPDIEGGQDNEVATRKWLRTEYNVQQFEFLLTISIPKKPSLNSVEAFASHAIRLQQIAAQIQDLGGPDSCFGAILGLLRLQKIAYLPVRFGLQAAMLARHLLADEVSRNNRSLALLSCRLHLNLGLGTIAFRHYGYAKVKEMLHDTVSWVLLSRISMMHPFDVNGPAGFSADAELKKVVGTIERMEARTDDLLYTDMQSFSYGSALELLDLKRRLKSSLTKHMCMIERRRIARLKGEPIDRSLDLDYKNYHEISDNYDLNVLPSITADDTEHSPAILSNPVTPAWVTSYRWYWEVPTKLALKEPFPANWTTAIGKPMFDVVERYHPKGVSASEWLTETECRIDALWSAAGDIASEVYDIPLHLRKDPCSLDVGFQWLFDELDNHTEIVNEDALSIQDNPKGFQHLVEEETLQYSYMMLEVLRTLARMVEHLRTILKHRSHRLKSKITKQLVDKLEKKVRDCYDGIRESTKAEIDRLTKYGVNLIKEHTRFGPTGEALAAIIPDDDLDYYAREYNESAIEALKGIMKVKLD